MHLHQDGHQRGSFKSMVVLSLAKTWLKTKFQLNYLTKYVLQLRILFPGHPCTDSLFFLFINQLVYYMHYRVLVSIFSTVSNSYQKCFEKEKAYIYYISAQF